ncbi:hypothetical protein EON09_02105 [Pseudomonas soli]|uniref:Uncharacterized protein n=1 Tax=Pseudomonas soli TaxID=1306993 RepID=A0A2V4IZK4_9PSED|nr:hypothetical protein C3F42_18570 [Pseudomonas sp. PONIH3]NBK37319.1 hypothetical protein [Pseudomonas soli]PYB86567.1 hypothetical protein DMX07_01890 [Pseudomonas soli]PYC46100.1 hypothetical protein DMX05_01770 [Pseudomonas soli]
MFLKERVRFVKLNGTRGYRHDATPLLLKISIKGGLQPQSIGKTRLSQASTLMPLNGTSTADLLHLGACHYPLFST